MFSFPLAQEFKLRAQAAIPSPRAFFATAAAGVRSTKFGACATLGAVALGGALLLANVARELRPAPVAAAPPAAIQAVALAPPKADPPKAVPVAAAQPPAAPVEKSTARVDTTPIGAISEPPKVKARRKHHPKKLKPLDADQ